VSSSRIRQSKNGWWEGKVVARLCISPFGCLGSWERLQLGHYGLELQRCIILSLRFCGDGHVRVVGKLRRQRAHDKLSRWMESCGGNTMGAQNTEKAGMLTKYLARRRSELNADTR
jgi:hypothetical protein